MGINELLTFLSVLFSVYIFYLIFNTYIKIIIKIEENRIYE